MVATAVRTTWWMDDNDGSPVCACEWQSGDDRANYRCSQNYRTVPVVVLEPWVLSPLPMLLSVVVIWPRSLV